MGRPQQRSRKSEPLDAPVVASAASVSASPSAAASISGIRPAASTTRKSPVYAGYERPTAAECRALVAELSAVHGHRVQPQEGRHVPLLDSLVNTILSQNTTDTNSRRAFLALKERFPSWETVRLTSREELETTIRSAGLAATKSQRIKDILNTLHEERGVACLEHLRSLTTEMVKTELRRFKGVGPKTISCMLLFNMRRPDMAVDTHIHRLAQRAGWVPTPAQIKRHNKQVAKMGDKLSPSPAKRSAASKRSSASVVPDKRVKVEAGAAIAQPLSVSSITVKPEPVEAPAVLVVPPSRRRGRGVVAVTTTATASDASARTSAVETHTTATKGSTVAVETHATVMKGSTAAVETRTAAATTRTTAVGKEINGVTIKAEVESSMTSSSLHAAAQRETLSEALTPWQPVGRESTYEHLNAMVPDELKYALHLLIIQHGKTVCRSRGCDAPSKSACPVCKLGLRSCSIDKDSEATEDDAA